MVNVEKIARFSGGSEWPKWILMIVFVTAGLFVAGGTPNLTTGDRFAIFASSVKR